MSQLPAVGYEVNPSYLATLITSALWSQDALSNDKVLKDGCNARL